MTSFLTLLYKEVLRFWKVGYQTIAAPALAAVLYQLIFSHVLSEHVRVYDTLPYASFLVPGLVMMALLHNAFANSSSSLIQSNVTGNIVFILFPPIPYGAFYAAYAIASMMRGLVVGVFVMLASWPFTPLEFVAPLWILAFALLGGALMGTLGVIAGLWADKFDQLAAFQNFLIMPLTFLSGVFYSIHSLPDFWQQVSGYNPVLYMIDGFRYGFYGVSDISPWRCLAVALVCYAVLATVALQMLRRGYKLRH